MGGVEENGPKTTLGRKKQDLGSKALYGIYFDKYFRYLHYNYSNPILFVSKILPLFGMGVWGNGQWTILSEFIYSF